MNSATAQTVGAEADSPVTTGASHDSDGLHLGAADIPAAAAIAQANEPADASPMSGDTRRATPTEGFLPLPLPTFLWFKALQDRAHSPRLDLRYLIEGAVSVATGDRSLMLDALAHAEAMMRRQGAALLPAPEDATELNAPSRTSPAPLRTDGCRAVRIGTPTLARLRSLQDLTQPRVDLRLMTSAIAVLFDRRRDLLTDCVASGRQALRLHLEQLALLPVPHITLEI